MTTGSLRPWPGEDRAAWTAAVFAAGDYAGAAMFGDPGTWQWRAARAMIVGDADAFAALARDEHAEARLHFGAARWIHGDDAGALAVLDDTPLPHARELARLVRQERIQVLAQLPWLRGTATDLIGAAAADPRFLVRNVSYHVDDVGNQPYADVRRFVDADFVPDFYVCAMVEWHHVPPNLQSLGCPILGHVADHDLHVQTLQPWLALFDEIVVTDRSEWLDVQGLSPGLGTARPVTSFPKVFGLPPDLPAVPAGDRGLDFFVSGTMLDEFHPDKAALMHELLSIPDISLRVVRGFAGTEAYHALLGASVASFTYVRRAGALPTRGLESLAMGCALATQAESVLNLWVGEAEGVVGYGPGRGSLARGVRRILANRERFGAAARRGAELVREAFDLRRVASQYLRYCAFRAAAPRARRAPVDTSRLVQKRVCVHRTWLPDNAVARRRSMQASFAFLGDLVRTRPDPAAINDMARELVAEFAYYEHHGITEDEERTLLADGIGLLERAHRACPDGLVLRFNLVRASLHHGSPDERVRALQLAFDTLDADVDWRIDAMDDVMPFDFHGEWFNYRAYLTLVVRRCRGEPVEDAELARLLLASLAGYLARKTGKVSLHERAVELDPGFARYRLDLADALLREERDAAGSTARAVELLDELAAGSAVFPEACERLEVLLDRSDHPSGGGLPLRRLREDAIDTRVRARALFQIERREPRQARHATIAIPTPRPARLAVLLPSTGSGRQLSGLLATLRGQTVASTLEVVVAAPRGDRGTAEMLAAYGDSALALRTVDVADGETHAARLNACARCSSAALLTVAMPGDRFRADALEQLAAELDEDPDAVLVTASDGWTAHEISDFRTEAVTAVSCRPRFAWRRQFEVDCIGLHPVWRRALHDHHGWFDAAAGAAAEYDLWLRATAAGGVRQRLEVLVTSQLAAGWRRERDVAAAPADMDRARRAHWSRAAGPVPALRPHCVLPAVLFTPSIHDEAEVHARLGIMSPAASGQVRLTEDFYATALLHGDLDVARLLLESCIERHPSLLSARLTHARLLEAMGLPEAGDVLRAGLACDPYTEQVRRELARRGLDDPDSAGPPGDAPDFVLPCPR